MFDPTRVRDLFDRAVQLAVADRAEFLDQACSDPQLRREIDRLLSGYDNFGDVFETDVDATEFAVPSESGPPRVIGAYRVVREIGRGGAGCVYLAVRDDDAFRKTVAIKVLRPEFCGTELIRRFRHERQILASIEHPFVAKLLDGGSMGDGSPYLVMEYIDGLPIDVYCNEKRLSTAERLQLFCNVCTAVQFAHQHLVVHRDIKPSNILVTADGLPKLLDFGIAKLLDPSAFALTMDITLGDSRLLTPEYASPEQIRGHAVTTSSDVYSLGVLLYRLLTGRRPYRLRTGELPELARAICEDDPTHPSDALTRADDESVSIGAAEPGARPPVDGVTERLRRQLKGDLDNIVLKAIRKEPDRRYVSAEQLADDIQRHLANLPVRAAADTVRYRASKFLRRHKASVATAALFCVTISAAASALAVQSATAARERDRAQASWQRAEREGAKTRAINEFLLNTFGAANPMTGTGREVTLMAVLNTASATARHTFATDPEIEAGLLNVVGMTFVELGKYSEAEPLIERALTLRNALFSGNHPAVAESLESKATLLRWRGEFDEAERLYRDALAIARRTDGANLHRTAQILHGLGLSFSQRGDDKAALTSFDEALQLVPPQSGHDRTRAELLSSAGVSHRRLSNYTLAEAFYREALSIQRRRLGPEHAEVGTILNNLGVLMNSSGRYDEAEPIIRESLGVRRSSLGAEHPFVANSMLNLAVTLEGRGAISDAAALYEQAARIVRSSLGPDHPRLAQVLRNWGVLLGNQQKTSEAIPLLREALRIRRAAFAEESRDVADALSVLGAALVRSHSFGEAEAISRQALTINLKLHGADDEAVAVSRKDLGALLCSTGRVSAGLAQLSEAAAFFTRHPSVEPRSAVIIRGAYGSCLTRARRFHEAEAELQRSYEDTLRLGDNPEWRAEAASRLATLYAAWNKPSEAMKFREATAPRGK